MNANNNQKVLMEYFNYLKSEEATIVYIAKTLISSLDTKNKWIDVVDFDSWLSNGNKFAFNYIIIEIFERRIHPKYPKDAAINLKKAITWEASHRDIEEQRRKGTRGPMFLVTCHLYNKNRKKKIIRYFDNWNEEYGGFDHTGKVPTTTIAKEVDMEPELGYRVTGIEQINDLNFQNIKMNYKQIYSRILREGRVMIDWFFESYPMIKQH